MSTPMRMYDATGAVIAWVADWVGPFEGGLTLAMKYAWANSLDGAAASKTICGKTLVPNHSQRQHGRSFLLPRWSRVARLDQQPSIGALISRGDINRYTSRWGEQLASDTYFRYCPECIQSGYQSLLFQVDALMSCPFHRTALLSVCRRCGASTPRFALTAEAIANPFCCPACGAAYGKRFDPRDWKCASLHEQVRGALLPLVRFLLQTKRTKLEWVHWQEWFGPWLGEVEEREKRIATFSVLRRIVPTAGLDDTVLALPARPLGISSGKGCVTVPAESAEAGIDGRSRRQIYKAIRRHQIKILPRHVPRRRLLNPESGEAELKNDILWLSLEKCPYLQAVWLWRLRFENAETVVPAHSLRSRELSLRGSAENWPWRGGGDDSVWAHYVLAGFHAAAEIVSDWWERALAHAGARDTEKARSLELYVEFANLLSPSRLPVPSRIAAVFETRQPPRSGTALYIVAPTNGMERLSTCCRCELSPNDETAGIKDADAANVSNVRF